MKMCQRRTSNVPLPEKASRAKRSRRVWKSHYLQKTISLGCSTRQLRRRSLRRSLLNPIEDSRKQPALISTIVVAEHILVQVRLKVFAGYSTVYAAYSALQVRPEPFERVRMNISTYVDLLSVVDAGVLVSLLLKLVVNLRLLRLSSPYLYRQPTQEAPSFVCAA